MRKGACLFFLAAALIYHIEGAADYDSLRRVDDLYESTLAWEVMLGYAPYGVSGVGYNDVGEYIAYTRFVGERQAAFAVAWTMAGTAALNMTVTESRTKIWEAVACGDDQQVNTNTITEISLSGYCEYRIAPESMLDPRLRLEHTLPHRSTGVAATLSCVLDPIVLGGLVGVRRRCVYPHDWLSVTLSAGLVANAQVSCAIVGQWNTPIASAGLPTSVMGFNVRYLPSPDARQVLRFRLVLFAQGQAISIGFGVSLRCSIT